MQTFMWFIFTFGLFTLLIMVISATKIVPQGSVGIIERMGRYVKTVGPGVIYLTPMFSSIKLISLKEQVDEYKPQDVITSDNVCLRIDAVLFFQIVQAERAIYEVENYFSALEILTMTTLRDIIGEMTLDECLTSREKINTRLRGVLDDATEKWGIKVNRVEIKTIEPPKDIRLAMERQMKAEREKRAVILEAQGQKTSAILKAEGRKEACVLEADGDKHAAILRAEGHAEAYASVFNAIKNCGIDERVISIKYLETLEKVANGQATTLIIPDQAAGIMGAAAGLVQAMGVSFNNGKDGAEPVIDQVVAPTVETGASSKTELPG